MITYRLKIDPLSSFITPFQSDTIFGHLAWAARLTDGEKSLDELLEAFRAGKPPFLVSAAFPEDHLPVPALPPPGRSEVTEIARARHGVVDRDALRETVEALKRAKKKVHLPAGRLEKLAADLSPAALYSELLDPAEEEARCANCQAPLGHQGGEGGGGPVKEVVTRTAINRITGAGLEGHLFSHEEEFFAAGARLEVWLAAETEEIARQVHRWLTIVEQGGFGKRKSVGKGRFKLGPLDRAELPHAADPNAFLTLSSYVPRPGDPSNGSWRAIIKRGKLGGAWATAENVWKKPLLMLAPGSLFRVAGSLADFYGGLVEGVHSARQNVVQYAFAFPLGVRWTPGRGEDARPAA